MSVPALLRKHATAAVLAAAAIGLAFYVLVIDRGSTTTDETEARKLRLFPAWRMDEISRVEVEIEGGAGAGPEKYSLVRPEKGVASRTWNLEHDGTVYPADEQVVDKLLSTFDSARIHHEVPSSSVNRGELGLDSPRARFRIVMTPLTYSLVIGKPTSDETGTYAEVEGPDGKRVVVIKSSLASAFAVRTDELRSRRMTTHLSIELAGLWLEGEGGTRKLERAPWVGGRGSGFRFADGSEGPVGRRVDGDRLNQIFVSFVRMEADTFLERAQADAASRPLVTMTTIPKEGARAVLAIGGACPGKPELVVVVRSEPSYLAGCVPEGSVKPLLRPVAELVDDGIVGAAVDEIVELRIERDGKVLDLARFGEGFKVRKPKEGEISAEVGNGLLFDIIDARGDLAPDDAAMPDGQPTLLRVVSQGGLAGPDGPLQRVEEVLVGPLVDGRHLAIRKEDGAKLYIGESAAAALRPSDLLLRGLDVISYRPIDVEEMTIEHGATVQRFKQSGPEVTLLEPKARGVTADNGFAQGAIAAFVQLQAVRWVAEQPEPTFGLGTPRFVIRAKVAPGGSDERTLVLSLGARTDDGVYAALKGDDAVFLLPLAIEDSFDRTFVSRNAFGILPADAERIEIEAGDSSAVLARDGRQLRWTGKSESLSSELEKALGKLLPLTAVGVGPARAEHGLAEPTLRITLTPRKASEADAQAPKAIRFVFGAGSAIDGTPVRYARRDDIDATFALPQGAVNRLVELIATK